MSSTVVDAFEGYRPEALQFLADLAQHNERAWFTPRKADFERLVKRPTEALCAALAERFDARGIPLEADPGRSPFRIYRDTRFSKDKSPYKTWQGAEFPYRGVGSAEGSAHSAVGGYFHLEPGEVFVGGGMYHPDRQRLAAFRALVDTDPDRVLAAVRDPRFVVVHGSVGGGRLQRVPQGYPKDHPNADLLRLTDVIFDRRLSDEEVCSPHLPDTIADALAAGLPVLRLLAEL